MFEANIDGQRNAYLFDRNFAVAKSEKLFHQIVHEVPDSLEGKMFGASCIKSINGKAVAILWKDNMLFKLEKKVQQEALKLDGSNIGSHLYAPDKPMKGWVSSPFKHSDKWVNFTKKAVAFAKTWENN